MKFNLVSKPSRLGIKFQPGPTYVDILDTNLHVYSDTQRGRTILFKGNQTLVRMYELRDTPEWHGNLAHEIFHAVEFILERVGMKLTIDSDEAYAYLIGYITTEIYKHLK